MRKTLAVSAWLALTLCALAAPVHISGPTQVDPYKIVDLVADGAGPDDLVFWDIAEEDHADIREKGGTLSFTGPPGIYHIKVRVVPVKDGKISGPASTQRTTVTIGTPVPPVPPLPPGPVPPVPPAPPGPVPIPVDGLRVLIVEDRSKRSSLPPAQLSVLFDKSVRDYLDAKTVMGADAKTHEWRIWDRGDDPTNVGGVWPAALKRANDKASGNYPWLIISDGKTGYEGPLPKDVDTTLNLLKTYAEPRKEGKP